MTVDEGESVTAVCQGCGKKYRLQSKKPLNQGAVDPEITQYTADATTQRDIPLVQSRTESRDSNKQTFGRYHLIRRLGRGGFGEVWEALDVPLERKVAIKLSIFPDKDGTKARRFLTEGKAAARLGHPNIAAIYDAGQEGIQYFIAGELIDGGDLEECYKDFDRGCDLRKAAIMIRDLAYGLDYAHLEQIIHRDIKPKNIVVSKEGVPKIIDFGLAKILEDQNGQTVDGTIMGTPAYMSPEQARGATSEIGPHSDQYSLGTTLYWLITGQRPFDGPYAALLAQVIHSLPPKPSSIRADIDKSLEAICLKSMSKHPNDRYSTCGEFAKDLDRYLRNDDIVARPTHWSLKSVRWIRGNPWVSTASFLTALVLLGGSLVALKGAVEAAGQSRIALELSRQSETELAKQQELEAQSRDALQQTELAIKRADTAKSLAQENRKTIEAVNNDLAKQIAENQRLITEKRIREEKLQRSIERMEAQQSRMKLADAYKRNLERARGLVFDGDTNQRAKAYETVFELFEQSRLLECRQILETMPEKLRDTQWQLFATAIEMQPAPLYPIRLDLMEGGRSDGPQIDFSTKVFVTYENRTAQSGGRLHCGRFAFPFDILGDLSDRLDESNPSKLSLLEGNEAEITKSIVISNTYLDMTLGERAFRLPLVSSFATSLATEKKLFDIQQKISQQCDAIRNELSTLQIFDFVPRSWPKEKVEGWKRSFSAIRELLRSIPLNERNLRWRYYATIASNETEWISSEAVPSEFYRSPVGAYGRILGNSQHRSLFGCRFSILDVSMIPPTNRPNAFTNPRHTKMPEWVINSEMVAPVVVSTTNKDEPNIIKLRRLVLIKVDAL